MLLEFSIENFRCYKEKTTFDFKKITAIFGSNASGKTNILKALLCTLKTIKEFSKIDDNPPLFRPNDKNKPVSVSLKFSDEENNIFLYELSVKEKLVCNEEYKILSFKDLRDCTIFTRKNKNITFTKLFKNDNEEKDIKNFINKLMLPNNTFASFIFSTKIGLHDVLLAFYEFTEKIFISIDHDLSNFKENDLLDHIKEGNGNKKEILGLAKLADSTITDLSVSEGNKIICHHGNEARNFLKESSGTRKTIYMTSMLIHAKKKSSILLIDEIDTHFHPLVLSLWLEKISETIEQIIFVGHNPLVIDFLMSWKVLDSINNIIYLYRNEEDIIKNIKGENLYIEDEDRNLKFSELIYHNWNNFYINKLDYI